MFNFGPTTGANTGGFAGGAYGANTAANIPIPTVATDPYGDQTTGFQAILQQSESAASKVEKDMPAAHERPSLVQGRRTPARIRSARPLIQDRLSLFGTAEEEEGLETQDLASSYAGDVKSLIINDESFISLPPLEEEDATSRTPSSGEASAAAAAAETAPPAPETPVPPTTPYSSRSSAAQEAVQRPTPRRGTPHHTTSNSEEETEQAPPNEPVPSYVPILTKRGYKTNPSYDHIRHMTASELARVPNFQIFNDYGSILWLGETNIVGLDLDELVTIDANHFVEVYPDSSEKPERGRGLNKKAIITINNVRPRKTSISLDDYELFLKKKTEREDAIFMEYDKNNFQWIFEVKHFSRYGLGDDDEEDEEEINRARKKTRTTQQMPPQKHRQQEPAPERVPREQISEETVQQPSVFLPVAHELGLNPSRMHAMRANLFSDESDLFEEEMEAVQDEVSSQQVASQAPLTNFRGPFSTLAEPSRHISEPRRAVVIPTNLSASYRVPQIPSPVTGGIAPTSSLLHERERSTNAAIFLGRSFRASFGPGGQLVIPQVNGSRICIRRLTLQENQTQDQTEALQRQHVSFFETFIPEVETMVDSPRDAPSLIISRAGILNVTERVTQPSVRTTTDTFDKRQLSVWKLVHALWGNDPIVASGDSAQKILRRKQLLSLWLQDEVKDSVIRESQRIRNSDESYLTQILAHLTGLQLPEAVQLAINHQDYILAALLSQAASHGRIQQDIRNQLAAWNEGGVDASIHKIDDKRVALYKILSGDLRTTFRYFSSDSVRCDWKRNFGMHLWYTKPQNQSTAGDNDGFVPQILSRYDSYVSKSAVAPSPPYEAELRAFTEKPVKDVLYWIIKRFWEPSSAQLQDMLLPVNFTSNLMDYRMSWALYQTMTAFSTTDNVDEQRALQTLSSHIHSNLIFQLESLGLWKYALYVALHFERTYANIGIRNSFIKNLLVRYIGMGHLTTEDDREFLQSLHIPQQWIAHARAIFAHYHEDYLTESKYLVKSDRYDEAHTLILRYIAPLYILSEKYVQLSELLTTLEPHHQLIQNWNHKGAVYLLYCRNVNTPNVVQAQEGLSQWPFRLQEPDYERAAVAQMTVHVTQFLAIASQQDDMMHDNLGSGAETELLNTISSRLYLPEHFRGNLLLQLMQQHLLSA